MSNQDSPYNSPTASPNQADLDDAARLRQAGETVRSDLASAFETVKGDLSAAADTAKSDLSAVKDQAVSQFQDLRGQAGGQAQSLKDQASGGIQTLTSQAKGQLNDATEQAKSYATGQVSQLTDKARSFATEQKDLAAQQISGVVDAVSRVAEELQGSQNGKAVAGYAQDIAGSLRTLADSVQNKSVDELFGLVQDFGKRQPLAFLGIAALTGFAVSRFLLATRNRAESAYGQGAPLRGQNRPYSSFDSNRRTEVELDRPSYVNSDLSSAREPLGMTDNGRI